MKEIKLYKSPWKAVQLIFLCSIFVAGGILMLRKPDGPHLLGWISIVFFGLGYPVGLFQLFDRRPRIILNETGLFDRTLHQDFIRWEVINDAILWEVSKQKFIGLLVDPSFVPSRPTGKWGKGMARVSKSLQYQQMNIWASMLAADAARLTQLIRAMRAASIQNRSAVLEKALPDLRR